jgi:DNA-binding MarR family transcriptional regulator
LQLNQNNIEDILFEYIEQFRLIISPETWGNVLMECSKNEMLVLLFLYRKGERNMSQVADYLCTPLNTATGIITRMENKKMVSRIRNLEDKRVVTLILTDAGKQQINEIIKNFAYYGQLLMTDLTQEELKILHNVLDKVINKLRNVNHKDTQGATKKIRKITIE